MNTIFCLTIITAISGVGGTGLGGVIGAFFKKDSSKTISLLLSFAGGIMNAIVCFDLVFEALNPSGEEISVFIVMSGILLGYIGVAALNYAIEKAYSFKKSSLFSAGLIMVLAIALHNFPEGMVIGASYAAQETFDVFSGNGIIIAIIIGLHNIPEGMAISVPLFLGGVSKFRAVCAALLSGVPTILGAIFGYELGTVNALFLSLSLSFASGAMLYVVFGELIPRATMLFESKLPAFFMLLGILVGMIIVFIL